MRRHTGTGTSTYDSMSKLPIILFACWLAASTAFVVWRSRRVVYIGHMVLPREQVVALAVAFAVVAGLALLWLLVAAHRGAVAVGVPLPPALLGRGATAALLLGLPLAAGGLYGYGRYVEPRHVVVREVSLGSPPPNGARPARIAVVSDLHVDGAREPWLSLAARVNATEPDVILFLGDTLNRRAGLPTLRRALAEMRAPRKIAVRGNWDVWYWRHLKLLAGTGFAWLDGALDLTIRGQAVRIVGLEYADDERGERGEQLLRHAPPGAWRIFAYHTPDLVDAVPSADLYVAGHTHGGQISIPGFGALVTLSGYGKRFERGAVRVGKTLVYTTPGIGMEPSVPLRVGVPPEVTLVLLGAHGNAAKAHRR